ncbi:cytochrome b5 isoform X3 [Bombus impatiens]|uniref:Cytochrome b5 isoform X3 n=1 Tax=Bombus impatiens TaxID=132113 RepID=A0A6P3UN40_BOMIM|nr:cytochrome b5 isoform X3 [Bombus impatiens]
MEKNQERSNAATKSMDLLGLTFQSLDFRDNKPQESDFLDLENQECEESSEQSNKKPWKKSKEDLSSCIETENQHPNQHPNQQLRMISLDEVAWHDTANNCWIVIHDFVYDCTELLKNHPGGSDVILEYAGRDATLPFIGTGHSSMARQSLERYLIGELPLEERIFRVSNGVKVAGL